MPRCRLLALAEQSTHLPNTVLPARESTRLMARWGAECREGGRRRRPRRQWPLPTATGQSSPLSRGRIGARAHTSTRYRRRSSAACAPSSVLLTDRSLTPVDPEEGGTRERVRSEDRERELIGRVINILPQIMLTTKKTEKNYPDASKVVKAGL